MIFLFNGRQSYPGLAMAGGGRGGGKRSSNISYIERNRTLAHTSPVNEMNRLSSNGRRKSVLAAIPEICDHNRNHVQLAPVSRKSQDNSVRWSKSKAKPISPRQPYDFLFYSIGRKDGTKPHVLGSSPVKIVSLFF